MSISETLFLEKAASLNALGHCVCECIPDDKPIKLYFDIDIKGPANKIEYDDPEMFTYIVDKYAKEAIEAELHLAFGRTIGV